MQIVLDVLSYILEEKTYVQEKERVSGFPSCLSFLHHKTYVLYKIMISFKTLHFNNYSQDLYDQDISALDFSKIKCSCGSTGHFHFHATYLRYLIINPNSQFSLSITRIKCESCGSTHALLPSIIIPHRTLSNPAVIKIIQSYRFVSDSASLISKITGFSKELTAKIISFYIKYHQKRLDTFLAVFDNINFYNFDFIINYFAQYHTMFMQRISAKNMTVLS